MSFYPFGQHPAMAAPVSGHAHHAAGRGRRAPRSSGLSQSLGKPVRSKPAKDMAESLAVVNYRQRLEAMRSFDLEDDMEFCPTLLSDNDISSIHSASSSERSSLASDSPEGSPTQQPQQIATHMFAASPPPFVPTPLPTQLRPSAKLLQPVAARIRNAIPIVNPVTGVSMSNPSQSTSPSRLPSSNPGRWW